MSLMTDITTSSNSEMTAVRIFWNSLYRISSLGFLFGAIISAVCALGYIILAMLGMLFSSNTSSASELSLSILGGFGGTAIVGIPVGLVVGLLNGLLIGAITINFFSPLRNIQLYLWCLRIITAAIGIVATHFTLAVASNLFGDSSYRWLDYVSIFIDPIFGLSMGWISQIFAKWYIRETQRARRE